MLQKIRISRRDVGKKYKNVFDDGVKGYLIHTLADQKGKIRGIGIMLIPLTFDFKFSSGSHSRCPAEGKGDCLNC